MQRVFEMTINGEPIGYSDKLELPEEYKKVKLPSGSLSGSIECEFKPNGLYLHQQKTGRPRLVKVMPW